MHATMRLFRTPALAAFLLGTLAASPSSAAVLFDGTANYVSANFTVLSSSGTTTSSTRTIAYGATTAFLSAGAGYTGPSIFGGAYLTQTNSVAGSLASPVVLRNDATNGDYLRFQSPLSGGTRQSYTVAAAVLFDSGSAGSAFGAGSSLTLGSNSFSIAGGSTEARWLAVDNGLTYVSNATLTIPTNNTAFAANRTLANPDQINWASWTPGSDLSLGTLDYSVAGSSFTNLTHVGVYYTYTLTSSGAPAFDIGNFSAVLTTVPEPSSAAALAGLAALALGVRRRRPA